MADPNWRVRGQGRFLGVLLAGALAMQATAAAAQSPSSPSHAAGSLATMSGSLEELTRKVAPAVVKLMVTGYGPISQSERGNTALIGRQHSIGSGVIVDPNGYIVTNAHVVNGALRIRVLLAPQKATSTEPAALPVVRDLKARIVGVDKNTDVAVLKVDATGLPTVPLGDYEKVRQGQIVLAFGSPEGLDNSVTLGVVSSVMRQPDPDRPTIYIQTDAAVNPGNSGGPLVDVAGNLIGINTMILSQSGGSEGIGFAVPCTVVSFVYKEILAHGKVYRRRMGMVLQGITPALYEGLHLPTDSGLIVADVLPGGPAETAGLRVGDLVLTVDGTPAVNLPTLETIMYRKQHGESAAVQVLRGTEKLTLKIPVVEQRDDEYSGMGDLIDPEKNRVRELGVLALGITPQVSSLLPELRISGGVIVVARSDSATDVGLEPGDVIHAVNGAPVTSLEQLRAAFQGHNSGDGIALQLERDGSLMYLSFDLD